MKPIVRAAGSGLLLAAATVAQAAGAHEHGVARLAIASGPTHVTLVLALPLDSVLGFEHAPRSDDERKQAALVLTRLRTGGALFRIDPAARCVPGKVDLQSLALGVGAVTAAGAGAGSHADVDARYGFICKDGQRAGFVEVGLFDFFARVQRVDVQLATPTGRRNVTLQRPASRVQLAQ